MDRSLSFSMAQKKRICADSFAKSSLMNIFKKCFRNYFSDHGFVRIMFDL